MLHWSLRMPVVGPSWRGCLLPLCHFAARVVPCLRRAALPLPGGSASVMQGCVHVLLSLRHFASVALLRWPLSCGFAVVLLFHLQSWFICNPGSLPLAFLSGWCCLPESWPGCWRLLCHVVGVLTWACCGLVGGSPPFSVVGTYSGLLGLGDLGVIVHCGALLCVPVLGAFAVLLCTHTTLACAFWEAHGTFVLVSGPGCFASMPRRCCSAVALPVGCVAGVWSLADLCGAVQLPVGPLCPVACEGALLWTMPY